MFAIAAGFVSIATAAHAGGGPENVFLLVNSNSESSKTIANHWIEMRRIPPQNVYYVDWRGSRATIGGKAFHDRILMPALAALEERKLNAQIDYIIYSSDFPFRISLPSLLPEEKIKPPHSLASLTGATYLTPLVVAKSPAIMSLGINWYVPGAPGPNLENCTHLANVPTRAFRSRYLWDQNGSRTTDAKKGQRYLLSTMLGVTYGRGNTVEEILSYLRRSASADGRRPSGTIYFLANNDRRSTPRDRCFAGVAAEINRLGVRTSVAQGTIPRGARDVMGLMAGVREFDWVAAGNTILPGAICEHLTSAGGMFDVNFQTPLSEFLRHGAAAASGTVKEPGALQAKFPLPSMHLHYVRGSSLAEAFYQSVSGPYQLLIVGDPLCRPWAVFPKPTLPDIKPGQQVSGSLSIKPAGTTTGGHRIGVFDLFVDGRLTARIPPGQSLALDTTKLPDGHHELRIVAVHAGDVETQGHLVLPIHVKNHDAALEFKLEPSPIVEFTGKLRATVRQPGAKSIEIRQNSRRVGRVQGEAGEVEIAAATLGRGPTTLQAFSDGSQPVVSPPLRIVVE